MKEKTVEFRGICHVCVRGAYPERLLNACAQRGLELWDLQSVDDCTLHFYCYETQKEQLEMLCHKCQCEETLTVVSGGSRLKSFFQRHMTLFLSFFAVLLLLCLSTCYVWDIDIYGNTALSEGELLRTLAECGVEPGCFWPKADYEQVKGKFLLKLPDLAWVGLNYHASKLTVLVRERQERPEIFLEAGSGDLTAEKAGVIRKMEVQRGKPQVVIGEAVLPGEILVSGLVDSLSRAPRPVRAQGVIQAETWTQNWSVAPQIQTKKKQSGRRHTRYAIRFGKNRINFYFRDRKTVDGYDKIIDNYKIGVEGVFILPITVVAEHFYPYTKQEASCADIQGMEARLLDRLHEESRGEVLSAHTTSGIHQGLCYVSLQASCREDIACFEAHPRPEES